MISKREKRKENKAIAKRIVKLQQNKYSADKDP